MNVAGPPSDGASTPLTLALLVLAASGAALGIVVLDAGEDDPDPERLLDEAIETRTGLDALSGERVVELRREGETVTRRVAVDERPGAASRVDVLESTAPHESEGDVHLENESATIRYDASAERIERRIRTVPHRQDHKLAHLETLRDEYDLRYVGEDPVGNRSAHVVEAIPVTEAGVEHAIRLQIGSTEFDALASERVDVDESPDTLNRTLWLDAEAGYPLKERGVADPEGAEPATIERRYERIELDPSLSDDRFRLDPPAEAEPVDVGPEEVRRVDSRSAAIEAVETLTAIGAIDEANGDEPPVPVPDPDLPSAYEFEAAIVVVDDGDLTVSTWYRDAEETDPNEASRDPAFYVERSTEAYGLVRADWEEMTVRGADGFRGERRGFVFVGWECSTGTVEVGHRSDEAVADELVDSTRCSVGTG